MNSAAAKGLLQADLASLQELDETGPRLYDEIQGPVFEQIFGGLTAQDIMRYLRLRIRYYLAPGDRFSIAPAGFEIQGWARDPNMKAQLKADGAQLIASNAGTSLWLQGVLNDVPVSFDLNGESVSVDSSRVGLMVIGDGYVDRQRERDGSVVSIPTVYRQSALIHEARHSDCTGGLTSADLESVRHVSNAREFSVRFTKMSCGHFHVYCPAGHQYHDLPACDNEPWGAYSVESVFAKAYTYSVDPSSLEWEIANAVAVDSRSRILVPITGTADMSSSGLQAE